MERLIADTVQNLVDAGLADSDNLLMGGIDDTLVWNQAREETVQLAPLFEQLNIATLVYGRPKPPYGDIIDYLSRTRRGVIYPEDTETRTFLHDIEILETFSAATLREGLAKRKGVILPGGRIAAQGAISPLQAYLNFSSICFACLTAFLVEQLRDARFNRIAADARPLLETTIRGLPRLPIPPFNLQRGPFDTEASAQLAMIEAGRRVVQHRLVDSLFGNISYRLEDVLYISQTGSALDRLAGNIDPVPLQHISTSVITASSELSAHLQIVRNEPVRAILHGHPPFSVAISLDCGRQTCADRQRCHTHCTENRRIGGIPIIPGEVGTGPTGLATTLPPAIKGNPGAIVFGHGVFTVGNDDFNTPFERLVAIERRCKNEFLRRCELSSLVENLDSVF